MLRLDVSWDKRKQSGQVDFNAGFTTPPAHFAVLCLASTVPGLAAALLAGRRLTWALELTLLSDVGNMFILSALLPTLTRKVTESKLSVTSTPESYNVSLVTPAVAWQSIVLLSAMTLGAAWNAAIVYGASSSLALLYLVASLRSFVAIVRLGIPESEADSKGFNLLSNLVGLHLTQMISDNFLGTPLVDHDEEEVGSLKESLIESEVRRSKHDVEVVNIMRVDGCDEKESSTTDRSSAESLINDEMTGSRINDEKETSREEVDDHGEKNGTEAAGSITEDGDAQLDGWEWEHIN